MMLRGCSWIHCASVMRVCKLQFDVSYFFFFLFVRKFLRVRVQLGWGEMSIEAGKINYLLAQLFWNQGKWEIAEKYCNESLRIRMKLLEPMDAKIGISVCI